MKIQFPAGTEYLVMAVGMAILSAFMFQRNTMPIVRLKEQADAAECRSRGIPLADCSRALRDLKRAGQLK
jgi:hypothetical protein